MNAKRGLHAPRAVDRGGRRPDDGRRRLRLRLRPRPGRGVVRARAAAAPAQRRAAGAARRPSAASATGAWSSSPSSRPTRAGWPRSSDALVRRDRPPARHRVDRRVDVPGGGDARRRHGDAVAAAAPSTSPPRSSSSARAAAWSPSPPWTIRSARPSTSSRTRPSWPPAPTARWPSWPRCPPSDGRLAPGPARRRGRRRRRRRRRRRWPAARTSTRWPRAPSERVTEYARMQPGGAAAAAGGRRAQGMGAREPRDAWAARSSRCSSAWAAGPCSRSAACSSASRRAGIVGFMGRNVLGQYELSLLDPERPPRLLLVAPNLREAARAFEADEGELLEWVVFHEITHAVQFTGVPWLREHLAVAAARAARPRSRSRSTRRRCCACPRCGTCARRGTRCATAASSRGRRARAQGDHRSPAGGRWRSSRATPST